MYFGLNDIELTNDELDYLLSVDNGGVPANPQVILALHELQLVYTNSENKVCTSLRGRRFIALHITRKNHESGR